MGYNTKDGVNGPIAHFGHNSGLNWSDKFGDAFGNLVTNSFIGKTYNKVDKKLYVPNDKWYGGESWDGPIGWENHGKETVKNTLKFNLAWATLGMTGPSSIGWASLGFSADGVADATSNGKYSVKALSDKVGGKVGVGIYDGVGLAVDILSLREAITSPTAVPKIQVPVNTAIMLDDIKGTNKDFNISTSIFNAWNLFKQNSAK